MQLMMIGFEDRRSGQTVLDELELACDDRELQHIGMALVHRASCGRLRVRHTSQLGIGSGLLPFGLVGLLAAIAPPAGLTAGGALGGVIAGVGYDAVDNPMMNSMARTLDENRFVLLAFAERSLFDDLLDNSMQRESPTVRQQVPEATVRLMRELSWLSISDLENSWGVQTRRSRGAQLVTG